MFNKLCSTVFCLAIYLAASSLANAALVTHNGYTLDEDTNIVTGGGLQWLQWDKTKGMSINDALTTYSSDDWRLATNAEMAALFNVFKFGKPTPWTNNETIVQFIETPYQNDKPTTDGPENEFLSLFGITNETNSILALYGSDNNNDHRFNIAGVANECGGSLSCSRVAALIDDIVPFGSAFSPDTGVALVRADTQPPTAVSEPPMLILFGTALALITYRRRKAQN